MNQDQPSVDQVIGVLRDRIGGDVVTLDTHRRGLSNHPFDLKIGSQHRAGGGHLPGHPPGDAAAPGADLPARPARSDSGGSQIPERGTVERSLQAGEPLTRFRGSAVPTRFAKIGADRTDARQATGTRVGACRQFRMKRLVATAAGPRG